MANGKIRFGKQSGGTLALVFPDGVGDTELVLPESGTVATTAGATEDTTGLIELATTAETQAGIDDTRAITPLKLKNSVLGLGQTWQDVTASRFVGTTYTNTSGKPIFVQIYCLMAIANVNWGITVDGARRSGQRTDAWSANSRNTVQAIIPNGSTYSVSATTGSITLDTWHELR